MSRRHRSSLVRAAACAASVLLASPALSGTKNWNAASSNWEASSNWSPTQAPVANDDVFIVENDGFNRNVTYQTAALSITSLTLDNTGLGTNTLALGAANANLTIGTANVGLSGRGAITENFTGLFSGGITVNNGLYLGVNASGLGAFNLGGSSAPSILTINNVDERVGDAGTGSFVQSGGTHTVNVNLVLANAGAGKGTYALSAGTLGVGGNETIGNLGTGGGTFTQTGGTHTVTGALTIGSGAASRGSYALSTAGTLGVIGDETVGLNATGAGAILGGAFSQSAGLHTIGVSATPRTLYVGRNANSTGSYTLGGGTLNVPNGSIQLGFVGTGTFVQNGGTVTASTMSLGSFSSSSGAYTMTAGTLGLGTGTMFLGGAGAGTFGQSGGAVTAGNLQLGNQSGGHGTYTLGAGATLTLSGAEFAGTASGLGTFVQTGGANVTPDLEVPANATTNRSSFTISAGSVSTLHVELGADLRMDGGTITSGISSGFSLSANPASTFTQTDGTFNGTGTESYAGAVISQSGGTHTAGGGVFSNAGSFTQTAGSFTINATGTNGLAIGFSAFNSGVTGMTSHALAGDTATLTVNGIEYVGYDRPASFNQPGGTHTVSGDLFLAYTNGASATFTLSGGSITANGNAFFGRGGAANFTQSGGAFLLGPAGPGTSASTLSIGGAGASGAATVVTMTATADLFRVTGVESVGAGGNGTFNQGGGTHQVLGGTNPIALLVGDQGGNGTYNLSGGLLDVVGAETIGAFGNGIFNQTGGAHQVSGATLFMIGGSAAFTGVYTLSGGTISGPSIRVATNGTLNFAPGTNAVSIPVVQGIGGVININSGVFTSAIGLNSATLNLNGGTFAPPIFDLFAGNTVNASPNAVSNTSFNQGGGTVTDTLVNRGTYTYTSGVFAGRLVNQGIINLGAGFVAGNGFENDVTMTLPLGQVLISNGQGFDNRGTFTLDFGVLDGSAAANGFGGLMNARGTISVPFTNNGLLNVTGALTLYAAASNAGQVNLPLATVIQGPVGLANAGVVTLTGGAITLAVNNNAGGLVQGGGALTGPLANNAGGIIFANSAVAPLTLSSLTANGAGGTLKVADNGVLNVLNAWPNAGLVSLLGENASLGGPGTITNTGTIRGAGQVGSPLGANAGVIRAEGGTLTFASGNTSNAAAGQMQVSAGATLAFTQGLTANAGQVSIAGGTFDNDARPLANAGQVSFTAGANAFIGAVNQTATGKLIVTGGASATFYNPITNLAGSEVRVGANSTAIFLGAVNGPATFTGAGTKLFEGGQSSAGPIAAGGVTVVDGDAAVTADYVREAALTVSGQLATRPNAMTSVVNALTVSPGGRFSDLSNDALVIDHAPSASTVLAEVRQEILSGGITSTSLTSATAIGYARSSDIFGGGGGTFAGQSVDASAVLVRYTLAGDATLDGTVDFNDLVRLAQNYNTTVSATSDSWWYAGDFTGDGITDFNDLVKLAQNYNTTLPGAASVPSAGASFEQDFAAAFAGVPEPSAVVVIGGIAAWMAGQRRRRPRASHG